MSYTEHSKRVFLNTGTRFQRSIIWSMGAVKLAAARANVSLGIMKQDMGQAIEKAALELMDGLHDEEITVDVFQTGSGTGINMNVNEVISKRATEILGSKVHPNDHVNMSQSSNDVVPTAIRVAAARDALLYLIPSLKELVSSLNAAAQRSSEIYKPGRTHLRDALPVTLGQELSAYAKAFERDSQVISASVNDVKELPIGGTAVGTGINSPVEFSETVIRELNKIMDLNYRMADN
ncbi:MAG: lyase family protein, partial [Conexivisphaerales archaeon]